MSIHFVRNALDNALSTYSQNAPQGKEPVEDTPPRELLDVLELIAGDGLDLDVIAQKVLAELSDLYTSEPLQLQQGYYQDEMAWKARVGAERQESMRKHTNALATSVSVDRVVKALSSFGLIATGVAGLAVAATPLAVTCVVVGACLALDQLLDDKLKKTVANFLAQGKQESRQAWETRIHLFCGVVSLALSLGTAGAQAVQIAMNVSQAAATSTKGITDYRVSRHKAELIDLDSLYQQSQTQIDSILSGYQDICAQIQRIHTTIHDLDERHVDAVRIMNRPIDL